MEGLNPLACQKENNSRCMPRRREWAIPLLPASRLKVIEDASTVWSSFSGRIMDHVGVDVALIPPHLAVHHRLLHVELDTDLGIDIGNVFVELEENFLRVSTARALLRLRRCWLLRRLLE